MCLVINCLVVDKNVILDRRVSIPSFLQTINMNVQFLRLMDVYTNTHYSYGAYIVI
jgi:hypothetical protein